MPTAPRRGFRRGPAYFPGMNFNEVVISHPESESLLNDVDAVIDQAAVDAVGVAIDDPEDPHVAVAVHGGRIVFIGISDPRARGDVADLQAELNSCIFTAFAQWSAQQAVTV